MTKRVRLLVYILTALFGWNFPVTLHVAQGQSPTYVPDEVIVKYRDGVDEYKKEIGRFRLAGQRKKEFKIVPGLEVIKLGRNVSVEDAIAAYQQDPDVLYAEPNHILHLTAAPKITATPNDPSFGSLWGLTKISAPSAWNITTGSNQVVVAVIDTGIDYSHPDLAGNMFRNEADCNNDGIDDDGNGYIDDCYGINVNVAYDNHGDPMDDHYHGTHVAGTIGAVGNNGIGVVGVNWNVKLLACKFFDADGSATTEGAIECLEYIKDLKTRAVNPVNIVASNNSWGGDENSQALYDAINEQRQAGILFISGAGNGNAFGVGQNNDNIPFYPCNYFLVNIICVAATTNTTGDNKAGFSNYGRRTVHVGAPGSGILSTVPVFQGSYASLDGTSMATPHVSGLAALLKAQNLNRDWSTIKNLILSGGDTKSSMANTITGKRINANGSMICSNSVIQTRLQPVANTISASPGVPVVLASLNINCATPNGNVSVSVSSGASPITLLDDGANGDQAAGDGIYSALWTPSAIGTYTLTFPGNDRVTVNVANPTISVTPSSLDFGSLYVNNSADLNFVVQNSGGGVLVGAATANTPFSIATGASYSLSAGQSQTVTVRFSPVTPGSFSASVTFTGADGASKTVTGVGLPAATLSASPTSVGQGGSVTATWSGIASPSATDWIALFVPGTANTAYLSFRYATGTASGSVPFTIPASLAPGTYELRLFSNGTYTRIGTSNSFIVTQPPQASLSVSPTSVGQGSGVTATWSGIASPSATDWIALFAPGTADTAHISFRYTTGTASGSVPFTIPASLAPGTYELRLFSNGTYTRIGTSNSFIVTPPPQASLSVSPTSVGQGGSVTATWSGIASPSATDWIALFAPGTANTAHISFRYTTGTASGSVPFTIPASVAPGTYELRLFSNGTYARIGTSNSFTVTALPPPPQASLSVSPTSVGQGGSVTATWSGIASPSATDWIALFAPGTADTAHISFRYATGTASGSVPFMIPASVAPGTYELRLFSNGTYTRIGTSNSFTVTALPPPPQASLSVSPTSVGQGSGVTATWSGIASPSATDWIALFAPGTANTAHISFRYTTGTASGSVPFTIPASVAPGTYELRLFSNGTYTRIGTSNSFIVTPPPQASLSVSPTSVGQGSSVTATWSGIASPSATDWIGLHVPGTADNAQISFRYTTGTASGSVPFTIPASVAPGTYELRLFSNGTYTRIGTSNSFIVTPPPQASLSVSPTSVGQGSSVTATWSGIASPSATDWIGLHVPGTADNAQISFRYTTGTASGSVPFMIPASVAPGTYELRLFSNGTYARIGTSNSFTVTVP